MKTKYIQPSVQVTNICLSSLILAGSAAAANSNTMGLNNIDTDDQW
ncbi:MAG: hypothetical protein IKT13_02530 [Paludibacteraceae bacterium]|nr:hypothetical protein [Paludibacteraceae bacterium]